MFKAVLRDRSGRDRPLSSRAWHARDRFRRSRSGCQALSFFQSARLSSWSRRPSACTIETGPINTSRRARAGAGSGPSRSARQPPSIHSAVASRAGPAHPATRTPILPIPRPPRRPRGPPQAPLRPPASPRATTAFHNGLSGLSGAKGSPEYDPWVDKWKQSGIPLLSKERPFPSSKITSQSRKNLTHWVPRRAGRDAELIGPGRAPLAPSGRRPFSCPSARCRLPTTPPSRFASS